ncbi:RNA-binding protein [Methanolobus halotolerans]|uniref:Exosome subunit n=1 Tax=Methanolobus halotolerans TaxID=2052935 RepID=A0A4E0PWP9_9EURY|nr:RNA-binding protein [Methanolobus halotolerans]TGC10545.1 exosome subunit [Methanolobus halotolerans]
MIHYIGLRVIAHSTEDPSRVRKALDFFLLNSTGRGEDNNISAAVEIIDAEGHYGNPIRIFSAQISRKQDSKALAVFIRQHMSDDDVELLRSEMPDRLDDEQVFHMRFDKQAAFEGRVELTSSSDAIASHVKIATYPKNRENAGRIVEELFG